MLWRGLKRGRTVGGWRDERVQDGMWTKVDGRKGRLERDGRLSRDVAQ